MSKNEYPGFITVRTSSTRLEKKCLLSFGEYDVVTHIIKRAKLYGIEPIICTSSDTSDDILESIAKHEKIKYFRGSLKNKLKRWSDCATHFKFKDFHTVDADDPFFDGEEMKASLDLLREGDLDMVCPTISSSLGAASVGYSLKTDIVKKASDKTSEETDTEMMWFYMEKLSDLKKELLPEANNIKVDMRLTLDYPEDYWLLESVRRMVGNFASRQEVNSLFNKNPDLYKVNWFRNSEWQAGQQAKKI
jgi:spore coat polysaccharide biosynthesis protein SpsF (cytidylyltransferase family)